MCRAIFPLYRLVQPSNGGLRCCYCQHSGHCIGIGAVAYRLHWRELRLTRILLAVHLPSSFAFRRRLHRFRIFASDLTGPSRLFFCRQRSFLSHRHWPGWDTAHSLTHTHAYGALSNHLLVVVNPAFLSIGYLVSVHLRLFDSNHFPVLQRSFSSSWSRRRIVHSHLDIIYIASLLRAGPAIHIRTDPS